jgi:hypothetical protein
MSTEDTRVGGLLGYLSGQYIFTEEQGMPQDLLRSTVTVQKNFAVLLITMNMILTWVVALIPQEDVNIIISIQ